MKIRLLAGLLLLTAATLHAQQPPAPPTAPLAPDTIVKLNGDRLLGSVVELTQSEIRYTQPDMPASIFRSITISEVRQIRYREGKVQNLTEPAATAATATSQPGQTATPDPNVQAPAQPQGNPPVVVTQPAPAPGYTQYDNYATPAAPAAAGPQLTYQQGYIDGKSYYSRAGAGPAVTSVTTVLFSPFLGWIPAVIFSAVPPDKNHLDVPSYDERAPREYQAGYLKAARKRKAGRVWSSFGISSGAWLAFLLIFGR